MQLSELVHCLLTELYKKTCSQPFRKPRGDLECPNLESIMNKVKNQSYEKIYDICEDIESMILNHLEMSSNGADSLKKV